MKSKKNVVLVGMMGAGKSSIGKLLSKKIGFDFVDIDKLIEEKEDKTIVEIFKINGEKYFRDLEEKISIEKLKNTNQVIALGGGAYLNRNIRIQTLAIFFLSGKELQISLSTLSFNFLFSKSLLFFSSIE